MKFLDSTAHYPQQPGVVPIKMPKTLALLEERLVRCAKWSRRIDMYYCRCQSP
ncbi:hypothetical protein ACNKHS_18545 [Shigella flexneri]